MSKTVKQVQIDRFREQILPTLNLLELADSPAGFLILLSKLMDKVKRSPPSAKICADLTKAVEKEAQEQKACKQRMMDWLLSKVNILEEAAVNRWWPCAKAVQEYKAYLKGERPELIFMGSFWHGVCNDFMQVCDSVARYGDERIFDGFATVRVVAECLSFDEPPIRVEKPTEVFPDSPEGSLLYDKLGHSFISAVIRKNDWADRIDHDIKFGVIQKIQYPEDEYAVLLRTTTEKDWEAATDSSLLSTFSWLDRIAHFSKIKPTPVGPLPNDLIRCDELSCQWQLQSFLSAFGADWGKAPVPRDKLWRLVQRFVLLLEEEMLNEPVLKKPQQLKNEAREFVQSIIERELLKLSREQRKQRTYDSIRVLVWKEAAPEIQKACTKKLIKKECSQFDKRHGWRPKRGKKQSPI